MKHLCLAILLLAIASCFSQQDARVLNRKKRALSLLLPALGKLAGPMAIDLVKKRLHASRQEKVVAVVNHTGGRMRAQCNSKQDRIGPHDLDDRDGFGFKFRPHFFGRTHYWCQAWWNNQHVVWPAYNKGAPSQDNSFEVYGYGVYLRGNKVRDWGQT